MEKNVLVVDEFGQEYGATYPKRAKGLVKNGRARFIDEHTICLACPPANPVPQSPDKEMTEDITMSDNNTNIIEQNAVTADEIMTDEPATELTVEDEIMTDEPATELTVEYVLTQIKAIQDNDAYFHQAINELTQMDITDLNDFGSRAKASAIAETVKAREETNRKLIDSYMKMYDKLTADDNLSKYCLDILAKTLNSSGIGVITTEQIEALGNLFDSVRHINN